MKQLLFLSVVLVSLGSCVNQRQKTNLTGRTDEVYFTPSDTRIKGGIGSNESGETKSHSSKPATKNYTGSYSDRLSNFGSSDRFSYNNYQPVLMPSLMYNNYTGWTMGLSYGYPMMGGYYSPFSPYYGYNMPFNNPFYANGWGGVWMTNYYPCYTYNPYMFNYGNNGYYGGYNNYNPYYNNSYSNNNGNNRYNSGNTNYGRRAGNYSPSTQNNSTQRTEYKSSTNTNTNSNSSSGSGWWKTSSGTGSTSSGGSSGGGGGSRSGGNSSSNTSTRRR